MRNFFQLFNFVNTHPLTKKFYPYSYKPFIRKLERIPIFLGYGNTIYIKDKDFVEARVNNSRKYSVLGKTF